MCLYTYSLCEHSCISAFLCGRLIDFPRNISDSFVICLSGFWTQILHRFDLALKCDNLEAVLLTVDSSILYVNRQLLISSCLNSRISDYVPPFFFSEWIEVFFVFFIFELADYACEQCWSQIEESAVRCVLFCFSVLGMHLFGGKFCTRLTDKKPCGCSQIFDNLCKCDRKNFDTLQWSLVTVFQVIVIYLLNLFSLVLVFTLILGVSTSSLL